MIRLRLEGDRDILDLDEVAATGYGVQAVRGVRGLGLPPVEVQWAEGAGDGAVYRGRRVRPRDIDLPLYLVGRDRRELGELVRRLARLLAGPCVLRLVDDGEDWSTVVVRVGGGDYSYGPDTTGGTDLSTVVTVRAGDPFFTSSRTTRQSVTASTGRGLLGRLTRLRVTASQTIGSITLDNPGDADAYPVWEIRGPGRDFLAVSAAGERLRWTGTLGPDEVLTIDTRAGTVRDAAGVSRYDQLAPAPRMWRIPPGVSTAVCALQDTSAGSRADPGQPGGPVRGRSTITCSWRARHWLAI